MPHLEPCIDKACLWALQEVHQERPAFPAAADGVAATAKGAPAVDTGSQGAHLATAAAVADENASLRAQLAAALLQLAAATPRRDLDPTDSAATAICSAADSAATATTWPAARDLASNAATCGSADSTAAGGGVRSMHLGGGGGAAESPPPSAVRCFSLRLASPLLGGFSPAAGINSDCEVGPFLCI